ncbi:hypothetical protein EYF80_000344 [Liparis tanakae]|uniref:Uncharacterized protein n=1 Tax=Liparis tanakae TaxID=230148 RepID=A0A4Z2JII6_9TELE|nr:hypothetical protein EYF80_000344 [Liparis tanakae]
MWSQGIQDESEVEVLTGTPPETQDPGPGTQDPGSRTQDPGPRTSRINIILRRIVSGFRGATPSQTNTTRSRSPLRAAEGQGAAGCSDNPLALNFQFGFTEGQRTPRRAGVAR